jgi:hypothetical protein
MFSTRMAFKSYAFSGSRTRPTISAQQQQQQQQQWQHYTI